jgi:hypothetical protein
MCGSPRQTGRRSSRNASQSVVDSVVTETLGFRPPEPPVERLELIDAWIGA